MVLLYEGPRLLLCEFLGARADLAHRSPDALLEHLNRVLDQRGYLGFVRSDIVTVQVPADALDEVLQPRANSCGESL